MVKIIGAALEFHLFANASQMHTHGRAPFCLPERSILKERTGEANLFKDSCIPSRHCRGGANICFRAISCQARMAVKVIGATLQY